MGVGGLASDPPTGQVSALEQAGAYPAHGAAGASEPVSWRAPTSRRGEGT